MANRPVKLKNGRPLDDDLIDKLGSEAERGYDLAAARRIILRSGRPARGEPTGESPRVTARVPDDVYRAATQRAKEEGLTVSAVLRTLLAAYAAGRSLGRIANREPVMAGQASDSSLTAAPVDDPGRRRTEGGHSGPSPHSRRTSVDSGGRKPKGL